MLLDYDRLPMAERRMYLQFLKSCQTPALLTIGGYAPLNLDSCVKVYLISIELTFVM